MEQMHLYKIFLQSFPETLILIYLGFALTEIKVSNKKLIILALIFAFLSHFIRTLPIATGFNVFIQLPVLVALLFFNFRIPLTLILGSIILGFLGVSFAEMLFIPLMSYICGVSIHEALASPFWHIFFPLPEFLFLVLFIIYLRRNNINIYKIFKIADYHLYRKSLILLSFSAVLVVLAFYFIFFIEQQQLLSDSILITVILVILIAIALSLILSWKMFSMAKQEKILEIQQFHIANLQEMIQIIKAQRHDFVNHLQVIYGLVSLGNTVQVKTYIKTLYKDV